MSPIYGADISGSLYDAVSDGEITLSCSHSTNSEQLGFYLKNPGDCNLIRMLTGVCVLVVDIPCPSKRTAVLTVLQ